MPESTLAGFLDHGTVARTIDADLNAARATLERLSAIGVDLDEVTGVLEDEGVAAFDKSFTDVLASLEAKADRLGRG